MRVIVVNPGEQPAVGDVLGLSALQSYVGGSLECLARDGHVAILVNGASHANGMTFNRFVTLSDESIWDVHGPFLLIGVEKDQGHFESLTDEDLARWLDHLPRLSDPV